eukprot:1328165-Amorphochlora_amoeboformis.AAC.2
MSGCPWRVVSGVCAARARGHGVAKGGAVRCRFPLLKHYSCGWNIRRLAGWVVLVWCWCQSDGVRRLGVLVQVVAYQYCVSFAY